MIQGIDAFKMKILLCFSEMDSKDCTVTNIAKVCGVDKYKVTRAVQCLKNAGLADNSNPRAPKLTEYGKNSADNYKNRLNIATGFLESQNVSEDNVTDDAISIAMLCSDNTIEAMKKIDQGFKLKEKFRGKNKFDGVKFCKELEDGTYHLPFTFYKNSLKKGSAVSMANDGFEHPCRLVVENNAGVIYLKIILSKQVSGLSGQLMAGNLSSLRYYDGYTFKTAGKNGDYSFFPASALTFVNYDGEQTMSGSVPLKIAVSVGLTHMPESVAIFSMFF